MKFEIIKSPPMLSSIPSGHRFYVEKIDHLESIVKAQNNRLAQYRSCKTIPELMECHFDNDALQQAIKEAKS